MKRQITLIILTTALILLLLVLFGKSIFTSQISVRFLVATVILFCAYEFFTMVMIAIKKNSANSKYINLFMALKTAKLLFSLGLIFVYILAIKIDKNPFLISFCTIYIIYLIINTLYLKNIEKNNKS